MSSLSSTYPKPARAGFRTRSWRSTVLFWVIGLIVGGGLQNFLRLALPAGAAKAALTAGVAFQIPQTPALNFLVGSITLGPAAVDISAVGLATCVGVVLVLKGMFS